MINLDRFSCPLTTERVRSSLEALQEQQELNKINLVDNYLSKYYNAYNTLPDAENVQETLYKVDLDLDMIENRIREF